MSAVISLCVDEEQKARLDALARSTGRPVAFYLREAVDRYLDEQEYLDTLQAEAEAVRRGELRTISLDQLEVECGLGD
ncbi:ribbon-helix-helix protein, CopG family [Corynebacterium mastitidis]|uniref:Ribbon-helix-helix protein, CopG family n=1 Tax=Corynebacterium mastitidis TaxID=161890 RepID=A0ABU8NWV7_9CORY